ncbi:MAG: XdhC family protein [Gammaproteobacteria bacterium]|nr:XdhC family protein [Gammaproteobacteria bacterium]
MSSRHIVDRFIAARDAGEALVLVTVYQTLGSTYSKAGARMLITAGGESQGLVSGGCLEGDLAERARRVLADERATTVTYDLRDEADELFGLGIGCNGLIRVVLQPLTAAAGYEPMASIADALLGDDVAAIATVIESADEAVPVGATLVHRGGQSRVFGTDRAALAAFESGCKIAAGRREAELATGESGATVLFAPLIPVPRVLILGAGLDAVPLVNVAAELGWRVSVADHRQGYIERRGFERAEHKHLVEPSRLASVTPERYDAIIVMTHHLDTDRVLLKALADVDVPYIGLLGPPARRERLIAELGDAGQVLDKKLRGPVGIDIHADSAETIALSIAAEIQSVLTTTSASG